MRYGRWGALGVLAAIMLMLSSWLYASPRMGPVGTHRFEPRSGATWTDSGAPREARQLKRRAVATVRPVPIPPQLVTLLRAHRDAVGAEDDGRLFRTKAGGPLQDTAVRSAWIGARKIALSPDERATPLAARPYDLRYAAASLWLNSGVPATEVARRLGHSVAVLLKVYANCIDGQDDQINARIEGALGCGVAGWHTDCPGSD